MSAQGELFRAHAHHQTKQGELFRAQGAARGNCETAITTARPQPGSAETGIASAHPQQGNAETDITSAPENCAKTAHFSPAKAMAVSIPHEHERAKAMAVSDNRPSWPTGSGGGTHEWWRGLAGRPVGGQCYKRRQTNAIPITSREPLLQTSSI